MTSPATVKRYRLTTQESAHGGEDCGPSEDTYRCDLDCIYTDYYLKNGTCDPTTGQGTYTREVIRETNKPGETCAINEYTDSCRVNCTWNDWVRGPCVSTGTGNPSQTLTRTKKIEESGGGTCTGLSTLIIPCFT
jgi:hypothetical protein